VLVGGCIALHLVSSFDELFARAPRWRAASHQLFVLSVWTAASVLLPQLCYRWLGATPPTGAFLAATGLLLVRAIALEWLVLGLVRGSERRIVLFLFLAWVLPASRIAETVGGTRFESACNALTMLAQDQRIRPAGATWLTAFAPIVALLSCGALLARRPSAST
jgi:hypothetical protein